jgi:hypothetical protein
MRKMLQTTDDDISLLWQNVPYNDLQTIMTEVTENGKRITLVSTDKRNGKRITLVSTDDTSKEKFYEELDIETMEFMNARTIKNIISKIGDNIEQRTLPILKMTISFIIYNFRTLEKLYVTFGKDGKGEKKLQIYHHDYIFNIIKKELERRRVHIEI